MALLPFGSPPSPWAKHTPGSTTYLHPKVQTQGMYLGDSDGVAALEVALSGASAFFIDRLNTGLNFFATTAIGAGFITGGIYVAGKANGSPGAETATGADNWLGGLGFMAHDGTNWTAASTYALPGVFGTLVGTASSSDFSAKVYMGAILLDGISIEMLVGGQVTAYINKPNHDIDFHVKWDSGDSIFAEGSSGNVGIGTTTSLTKLYIDAEGDAVDGLKAQAYDIMAQIEYLTKKLNETHQQIAVESQREEAAKKDAEKAIEEK